MFLSLVAGCAARGSNKSVSISPEAADYEDFITVDVYDEFANYQGLQSGWFAKAVKDRFNMELNIIAPNVSGSADALFHTRTAAGNLGDLILVNTGSGKWERLVDSGMIIDCTDLIKDKDIMKNYGDAVNRANEMVRADGIYGFPNSVSSQAATEASEGPEPTFGPYIRWDYYKQLGYPEMKDLNDFLDVLEKMQQLAREEEKSNDIYAISLFRDWDDNMMNNAKQLVCMYGYDEQGFVMSKADGSDYQSVIDEDSLYVQVLRFLNEANARGLVDPESVSQNYDTWLEKYRMGRALYSPWPWVGQSMLNTAENKAAGKGFMMASVTDMQIFSFGCCPEGDATRIIAIGSRAEDPQRMADFIDWLYSPEGVQLSGQANGAAGPMRLTWEIAEDGLPVLTKFGQSALPNHPVEVPEEYGGGIWEDGVSALNFKTINLGEIDTSTGAPYDYLRWKSTIEAEKTPLKEEWTARMGADTAMQFLEKNHMLLVAPGSDYSTPEEDANITTIREQLKTTIVNGSWRLIFASSDEFDSLLSELQETAIGLGYQQVYAVDLKNAKDQTAARRASAEKYSANAAD